MHAAHIIFDNNVAPIIEPKISQAIDQSYFTIGIDITIDRIISLIAIYMIILKE